MMESVTRRVFLRKAAGAAFVTAGLSATAQEGAPAAEPAANAQRARVVLVRDENVLDGAGGINAQVVERMLDDAVKALIGESDAAAAWKRIILPGDVVGIKTNEWKFLPTPPELEAAIRRRVIDAGVQEANVAVADRAARSHAVFQKATALINVRPMRSHHWAGVGSCLKNYIPFSDNPPSWHDDSCANLAGLWELPVVKGKTRLNVLVVVTPLFQGKGPHHFDPEYVWPYKGLIVGKDPVAVDATGLRILEAKRQAFFSGQTPFAVPPKHIRVAQDKYHLGIADPGRIDVVKLGWMDGALI